MQYKGMGKKVKEIERQEQRRWKKFMEAEKKHYVQFMLERFLQNLISDKDFRQTVENLQNEISDEHFYMGLKVDLDILYKIEEQDDFYKKKQQDVIEYLTYSKTNWASVIVAKEFQRLIEPWTMEETPKVLTKEMIKEIEKTVDALEGKTGSEICECYRKVMQITGLLAECKEFWYIRKDYKYHITAKQSKKTLFYRIGQILQRTLIQCFDKELSGLAIEFYEEYGEDYFSSAVVAKLLENHKDVLDWIVQQRKEEKVSKKHNYFREFD